MDKHKYDELLQTVDDIIKEAIDKNALGKKARFIEAYTTMYNMLVSKWYNESDKEDKYVYILQNLLKKSQEIDDLINSDNLSLKTDDIRRRIYEIEKDIVLEIIENNINSAIPNLENNYNYYPIHEKNTFNNEIFNKKEFSKTKYEEERTDTAKDTGFSLSKNQTFVKNYISEYTPYNGILIWHEVGVGKTCSGITIAENFRKKMYIEGKKTIILTPSETLQQNWRDEIFNIEKELKRIENKSTEPVQCTGNTYYKNEYNLSKDNIDKVKMKVKKDINLYYEFYGYGKLAKSIVTELKHYKVGKKSIQKTKIDYIRKRFSNRVIIMDEVHVMRESGSVQDKKALPFIELIARYAENTKFILLTATPMYNISREIILLINILLWNDKRAPIDENKVFESDGIRMKNTDSVRKMLLEKTRGYISYVRGENPKTFPISLWPVHENTYIPSPDDIDEDELIPSNTDFKLFKNQLSDWQKHHLIQNIDGTEDDITNNAFSIKPSQSSNIVFPSNMLIESGEMEGELSGELADRGIAQCFTKKEDVYYYEDYVKNINNKPFLHMDNLAKFSIKFKNIIESISTCKGIVFVFSQFLSAGNFALALALEENGFVGYDGNNKNKNLLETNRKRDMFCARHNKYYSKLTASEKKNFKQARYILLDGSITKVKLNNLVKEARGEMEHENVTGEHIKVILGTRVVEQGISFQNIREVHIMDPWHHLNQMKQATGRAIRNKSHIKLDESQRNVTIYLHAAHIGDERESSDERIYRRAFFKKKNMAKLEIILKKNAVDCELNKLNNIRLSDKVLSITNSKGDKINYKMGDVDYSEKCNFSKCEMTCTRGLDTEYEDNDTWNIFFTREETDRIRYIIKTIFSHSYSVTIENIINDVEYNLGSTVSKDAIYLTLNTIINNKEKMYDNLGRIGYIREIGNNYIFQPEALDEQTPMLYRFIPNFKRPEDIEINFTLKKPNIKSLKINLSSNTKAPKLKAPAFEYNVYINSLINARKYTDTYIENAYNGTGRKTYYSSLKKSLKYKDYLVPTIEDLKLQMFYSIYEDGLTNITPEIRMNILKEILQKKINENTLIPIEEDIYKYYSRNNTIKYILTEKDFDPDSKTNKIHGFRFVTDKARFIFVNKDGILVKMEKGYNKFHFTPDDVNFLNDNESNRYGFIETKLKRDKTSSNEFVIINKDDGKYREHKTILNKHNKKYDRKGALCGQAKGAKDTVHLEAIIKDMIGDENYTEADKKNSRKVLPHKNYNDSGRSVPKRTMCQEIELLLRFNDFADKSSKKRHFYTFEERLLEIELIKQKN